MDIHIKKYCRVLSGKVWVDGEMYLESESEPSDNSQFLSDIYHRLGIDYRKFFKMDVLSKTGFLSAEILLEGFEKEQPKEDMGIVLFNRSASLEADSNYQQTIGHDADYFPSPAVFVYTLPNIVTGEIAIRNKIHGETAFYVFSQPEVQSMIDISREMMFAAGLKYLLLGWQEVSQDTMDTWMVLLEKVPQTPEGAYPESLKELMRSMNYE
ncbi:MAG: hypothetical protein LBV72_16820 [Tannerella sp.]|jgi:hypothetical protein|nr:hypothetical protein [Tannerella sp.]